MTQAANSIQHIDHWVSVDEYAKRSGIRNRAVYQRIKRKAITCARIDNWVVIESKLSAPIKQLPRNQIASPFRIFPGLPPLANLIRLKSFCEREGIRGHTLFSHILMKKIPVWCFAEHVFVEDTPQLKQCIKHKPRRGNSA